MARSSEASPAATNGPTPDDYVRAAEQLYPELKDFSCNGAEVVALNDRNQTVTIRCAIIDERMSNAPIVRSGE